ncbi:MAG: PTS sugar transporter subunit IIA [Anaerostipes sp.]|nr:PTS sugar transporter subunit IIA [Anaerostipes sp.]
MNNKFKVIAIEKKVTTSEEAIKVCGATLEEAGLVDTEFVNACLTREKEFPTGIASIKPVAIPHCKHDGIKQNSICLLRTETPVEFYRMEDPEETVKVNLIFNLAIKDSKEHLEVLQQLIQLISNEAMVEELMAVKEENLSQKLELYL